MTMKRRHRNMETNIPATASGKITNIMVNIGDKLEGDDLIMKIE